MQAPRLVNNVCIYVCALFPPLAGELTIPHIVQEMQNKQSKKQKKVQKHKYKVKKKLLTLHVNSWKTAYLCN